VSVRLGVSSSLPTAMMAAETSGRTPSGYRTSEGTSQTSR
jgi:hypothetical protein